MAELRKIRLIKKDDNTIPFIVTFPQNHPPTRFLEHDSKDDDEHPDLLEMDLFQHKHVKNKFMLHASNSKFDWLASNSGRNYKKTQAAKYAIGFYEEGSDEIFVAQTEFNFNLKQHFKDEEHEEEKEGNVFQGIRAIDQKKLLVEEMGNKRSKKLLEVLKTSIVRESNISNADEIKDILKEKAGQFEKEMQEGNDDPMGVAIQAKKEVLPEFFLDSQVPEKIFNIHSIIPKDEWELLDIEEIKKNLKKEKLLDQARKQYTRFVFDELTEIKEGRKIFKGDIGQATKFKYLIYLNTLLKFLQLRFVHKNFQQLSEEFKVHVTTIKSILSRFYIMNEKEQDKISYSRNDMLTDKLIFYIVILALFYNDFDFDATSLLSQMKIETKKFLKYCGEIGCTTRTRKIEKEDKIFIKLEAPLKIKPLTMGKKKNKK